MIYLKMSPQIIVKVVILVCLGLVVAPNYQGQGIAGRFTKLF